ncbi:NmrA family NAD(P)-binding protein [Aestuariicoccus sp. MJ-SS9]|uniref:NmrA family NAD(P)-binding protein n=1 Tax=Aestuariicoccus sp. MJ-SS9 TaxID=3079855 RepID=UPI0029094FB3|nr:NmrA family NAD(P)-binding protein [Aestuariicoccus sp. MJ-SS9]MDU8913179.1 NmrA family NAD(P)-binding protein [Aestuariicoccus sp. MJ-SS9]
MPNPSKILVTSAAGRIGRDAVAFLIEAGHEVRAMVHRRDDRAAELGRMGAEVVVGNLLDYRDVETAMQGVDRAFHIPPFTPHLLHNTMLVCLAAQAARLESLVLLSGWNPSPEHPSMLTREHWIANNVARWMPDVAVIHLNPGIFAFPYLLTTPITRKLGVLTLPFGDGANAPVAERDIARCAAALLDNPQRYAGTSWRPTGPALLTGTDVAAVLTQVFGRPVRYRPISFRMFSKAARAMGFPDFDSHHLRHYAEELANGAFAIGAPTDHVARLTGRPAESFATTAERYARDVTRLAPNVRDASLPGAVGFMLRMLLTPAPDLRQLDSFEGHARLASPRGGHQNPRWQAAAAEGRLLLEDGPAPAPKALAAR